LRWPGRRPGSRRGNSRPGRTPAVEPLSIGEVAQRILIVRGQRVLLDADLAELYGVSSKVLVQAVKRNLVRFPADFMFQLSAAEFAAWRSQTVTSNAGTSPGRGGRRTSPYAVTEQGVAILSTVLGSPRAIAVNIEIMRTFVRVRALAATHGDLAKRLADLEEKTEALAMNHDTFSHNTRAQLKKVFDALRELMTPPDPPKRPIGFINPEDTGKKTKGARGKP
jgi:ORF6N domain